jgi:hypothetical protein
MYCWSCSRRINLNPVVCCGPGRQGRPARMWLRAVRARPFACFAWARGRKKLCAEPGWATISERTFLEDDSSVGHDRSGSPCSFSETRDGWLSPGDPRGVQGTFLPLNTAGTGLEGDKVNLNPESSRSPPRGVKHSAASTVAIFPVFVLCGAVFDTRMVLQLRRDVPEKRPST